MLLGFTSDGLPKRTPVGLAVHLLGFACIFAPHRVYASINPRAVWQEEQRRVTNREMCRDELLGLLREAAALGQAFGGSQPANGASDQLRGSANSGTSALSALRSHHYHFSH